MEVTEEQPIALRKSKRRISIASSPERADPDTIICKTPSRRTKRVRFSDSELLNDRPLQSTGITPFIRQTSLGTPRKSTFSSPSTSNFPDTVQFTPYRQVLDERFKRRVRRNGLSDEMNKYEADLKTREELRRVIDGKDAELQLLRAQLEVQKRNDISGSVSSSQRADDIENELVQLRQSFSEHVASTDEPTIDWTCVPHGQVTSSPGGDTIPIWEDADAEIGGIGEDSTPFIEPEGLQLGLDLESAKREKSRLFAQSRTQLNSSFDLNFADSPAASQSQPSSSISEPRVPSDFSHRVSKSLKAMTQRAEEAENALAILQQEIKALGFEGSTASSMLDELSEQFRTARLELERTVPGETAAGFETARVVPEILVKLKLIISMVRDRDAELKSMRDQQRTLKGNFDHALIAADRAKMKVKELEDEINNNAENMLHVRMRCRELERSMEEKESSAERLIAAIQKYQEEARKADLLIMQLDDQQDEKTAAVRKEVSEEMGEIIAKLETKLDEEQKSHQVTEEISASRLQQIRDFKTLLEAARQGCKTLEAQLDDLQSNHETEIGSLNVRNVSLSTALALSEAEVEKLRAHNTKLEELVQSEQQAAFDATDRIQADFVKAFVKANERKKRYQNGSKIRKANWELEYDDGRSEGSSSGGPMTPASLVRFSDVLEDDGYGDDDERSGLDETAIEESPSGVEQHEDEDDHVMGSVEVGRGKGKSRYRSRSRLTRSSRRKYDSGIGMNDEDADSVMEELRHTGMMTPDLSSEVEFAG